MSPAAVARTPLELVQLSADHLRQRGSDSPRLDAELLVAHALGVQRLDLYLTFERPLDEAEVGRARELIRRRSQGEPVAYLVGEKEFFSRSFTVTSDTLIPRPDTETLIECVLGWCNQQAKTDFKILDLGTGSGCVGVTLACELPEASVLMTDVSDATIAVARNNAVSLGVGERVVFATGSWWSGVPEAGDFDIVVSNPPYITDAEMGALARDVAEFEPRTALAAGQDGMDAYRQIIAGLGSLRPRFVALEVDANRAHVVAEMLAPEVPHLSVAVHQDLAGHDRVVMAK